LRILAEIFLMKGVIVLKFRDFLPTRILGAQLLTLVNMYYKHVKKCFKPYIVKAC